MSARYTGSNSERQSVGDPGHCERCALVGHVLAHPNLGCADVGCSAHHGDEEQQAEMVGVYREAERMFDAKEGGFKRTIYTILQEEFGLTGAQANECIQAAVAQVQSDDRRKAERDVPSRMRVHRMEGGQWVDITEEWVLMRNPERMRAIKKALREYAIRDTRGYAGADAVIRARLANMGLDVETIEWVMKP